MIQWKDAPLPLKRKIMITILVGLICLVIGIAIFIISNDKIMLILSLAVCGISVYKAFSIYQIILKKQYEVVEGTCVGIVPKPLRKYRKIRIMDDEGNESTLLLHKQSKIKIGDRYCFYFKQAAHLTLGNEYLDAATSSDCFLGYEECKKQNEK